MYSRWQSTLNPVVIFSDTTYEMWLVYLQNSTIYIYTYIIIYPPSGACAFNAVRTTLHILRERIHVLRKRPQDILMSSRPRCAVVISHTTDTQPLPHDRDCPQASIVLRERVQDSHHPVVGYLPSYLVVGALLLKYRLHKVKAENKSLLACHLLRLL
jgi:hypothetical protein